MSKKSGYGQYCPVSIAAEVIAHKWTPLVLRALFCHATRYNEIARSVPGISSALLSRRLKELEFGGIIERVETGAASGPEYRLTEAGNELFPVLDRMGAWAQKWLHREITRDENLNPDILMWELRQFRPVDEDFDGRRVVKFQLDGVPVARRFYWLVFEPDDTEICIRDPGHDVDLTIHAHIRTLIDIWLGHKTIAGARGDGALKLEGPAREVEAFHNWFVLSRFSKYGAAHAEVQTVD